MSTAGLTPFTGSRKLRTLDQDSGSPSIAVRHKAIVRPGSELPSPADTAARQTGQVAFTCLAVGILRRASAEVRTRQTSAADMACSEGTPAVILAAMEVAAAIPMVITARDNRRWSSLLLKARSEPRRSRLKSCRVTGFNIQSFNSDGA